MPRKTPAQRRKSRTAAANRRRGDPDSVAQTVAELERVLDGLLEEGIGSYDDQSDEGRRRMAELHAGFAAGEALLAERNEPAAVSGQGRVDALSAVIRYILHWAGEERTLDEPRETIAAMRAARRALERATDLPAAVRSRRSAPRRRGGAAGHRRPRAEPIWSSPPVARLTTALLRAILCDAPCPGLAPSAQVARGPFTPSAGARWTTRT